MPNLTTSSGGHRKSGAPSEPPPTRIVVVRDDAARVFKSVRPGDDPSRSGVRIGFWTSMAVALIAYLWMTGHVGETHGFARAIGLPELSTSSDLGLVTGLRMTLAAPLRVFEMTFADPLRLAAAFVLVSIPAAGLAVSSPRVPGGPRPPPVAITFAWLGLVAACVAWALMVTWIVVPMRRAGLVHMPFDRADFPAWSRALAATAGSDAFAFLSSVLWLVLLFRLPLPRLARSAAGSAGFIATFVIWTGFATSNGIADGLSRGRSVIATPTDTTSRLLLGNVGPRLSVLGAGNPAVVSSLPAPEFVVDGHTTLAEWLSAERLPE